MHVGTKVHGGAKGHVDVTRVRFDETEGFDGTRAVVDETKVGVDETNPDADSTN